MRRGDPEEFSKYGIVGPAAGFMEHNDVKFEARAEGTVQRRRLWHELETNPNAAVIDAFAIGGGGDGGGGFAIEGIENKDRTFKRVTLEVRDGTNPGAARDVQVVGVIATRASLIYNGLYLAPPAFDALFPSLSPQCTSPSWRMRAARTPRRRRSRRRC